MPTATVDEIESEEVVELDHVNRQFLTFRLGEEHYGVDILTVQEIKGYTNISKLPNMPEHVKGVLNLRGTIVPITDLRMKFNMGSTAPNSFTVVVVVNVAHRITGFLVDAVSDVLDFSAHEIQLPPEFGGNVDIGFIEGIATHNDQLVTLLNINCVLDDEGNDSLSN